MKIKTAFFSLVIVLLFCLLTLSTSTGTEGGKKIVIAYTNNLEGYLEPCGCAGDDSMLGGLYKRVTYLTDLKKKEKRLVVVDSGDLLNEHVEIKDSFLKTARLKAELIAGIYKVNGIDAINVGELDLALGLDYLKELKKKYDTPFVSANIVDAENHAPFSPYIIKNMDGLKAGIIGIMGNSPDIMKEMKGIAGDALTVLDPVDTVKKMVAELKDKVDFIIVLTHDNMGRNWVIARKIDGIDVIVGGHHTQKLSTPYEANDTYIVQAGEKGQYQGMLDVTIAPDGAKTAQNTLVPMGDDIANNTEIKSMVNQFQSDVNLLYTSGGDGNADEKEVELMLESCRDCHGDAYDIWKNTAHAKAYATLVKRGRQGDPDCLSCHTVRFEQPGGFTMESQQKELRNVQCDSCHGDSTAHLEDFANPHPNKPGVETCLKCHTEYRCPDFEKNYLREWEKIKH